MIKILLGDHSISEGKDRQAALEILGRGVEYDFIIIGDLTEGDLPPFTKTVRAFSLYASVPVLVLSRELSLRQQFEISNAGATCWPGSSQTSRRPPSSSSR